MTSFIQISLSVEDVMKLFSMALTYLSFMSNYFYFPNKKRFKNSFIHKYICCGSDSIWTICHSYTEHQLTYMVAVPTFSAFWIIDFNCVSVTVRHQSKSIAKYSFQIFRKTNIWTSPDNNHMDNKMELLYLTAFLYIRIKSFDF